MMKQCLNTQGLRIQQHIPLVYFPMIFSTEYEHGTSCVFSGFHREADENCALHYTASIGNSYRRFGTSYQSHGKRPMWSFASSKQRTLYTNISVDIILYRWILRTLMHHTVIEILSCNTWTWRRRATQQTTLFDVFNLSKHQSAWHMVSTTCTHCNFIIPVCTATTSQRKPAFGGDIPS